MDRGNTRESPLESVKSDWGYVPVRENAHMFWWLFFQDPSYQPSFLTKIDPIPLVVWLQVRSFKLCDLAITLAAFTLSGFRNQERYFSHV